MAQDLNFHSLHGRTGIKTLADRALESVAAVWLTSDLLQVTQPQNVCREIVRIDLLWQDFLDILIADELQKAVLDLLERHVFAVLREQIDECIARQEAFVAALHGVKGCADLLRSNRKDRPVIHVQLYEVLEANTIH